MTSDDEWGDSDTSDWGDLDIDDSEAGQSGDHSTNQSIPRDIRARALRDVEELRMIAPFVSSDVLFGRAATIGVRIGFPINVLRLNVEQARAWALPKTGYLLIEINTPAFYFDTHDRLQIKVSLGFAPDFTFTYDQPPLQKGKVTWPLDKALRSNLLPVLGTAEKPGFDLDGVYSVMESCECSLLTAVGALRESEDVNDAIDRISSKNFRRSSGSPSAPSSYHSWTKRMSEEKSRSVAIQKLDKIGTKRTMVMSACGVTEIIARQALKVCDGDVQAAIILLVAAGEDAFEPEESKDDNESNITAMNDTEEWHTSPILCGSSLVSEELVNAFAGHNFLVRIAAFVLGRLTILSSLCMMCEKQLPHVGLNLTICSNDLCCMTYEKMGVDFDLAAQIKSSPALTDLYLSMLFVAASSGHIPFAFPKDVTVSDKDNKDHCFQTDAQTDDYARLNLALSLIPTADDLIKWIDDGEFYQQCDKLDLLIIPLLRWLFQSNPSFLRELAPHERLKSVNTSHQFILLMSSPDKEAQFQMKKTAFKPSFKRGSIYAWHGSNLKNWHSIMRVGLKNLSGTQYQAHGAAFGQGIYCAPDSLTSRPYCGHASGWPKSRFGSSVTALALCEVISMPTFTPHLVIQDESVCTTRYLFLFDGSTGLGHTVQAKSLVSEMHPSLRNFDPASALSAHRNSTSSIQ